MKKIIGIIAVTLLFIGNVNALESVKVDANYVSCVTIAGEIANGDMEVFRAAYVGCINGRL